MRRREFVSRKGRAGKEDRPSLFIIGREYAR